VIQSTLLSFTRVAPLWLLLLCFSSFAFSAVKVAKIEVQGNRKVDSGAILTKLQTKPGSSLSPELIRQDIKTVFGLGYFENVQVEQEEVPGGVNLYFVVSERPVIAKLIFEGVEAIEKDEVKTAISAKEFEVLDIHKLNLSVKKMNELYEEKGHYLADVRYEIALDEKRNEATVTFKVVENDRVQVKQINIIGNKAVSDSTLKGFMQTREGDLLSFISGSGSYREAIFERDIATLGYYYGTLGYVRARFGKPEVTVSPDKKYIFITFSVEEGEEYTVGKVDFAGDLLYSRAELQEEALLQPLEVFNTDTLRRETLRLTEKYSDLGYAFANVVPQPVINDETRVVDLVFEVDKGQRVFIGQINITGNSRTKDHVIRRELLIDEGELFNGSKKRLSRENVLRLGFFDEVEFHQTTSKLAENVVDIEIKIKERSTGQLVIGAGYGSGPVGFTFQAQLSQNNFLGNGQVASLSANILTGQRFYEFNLGFQDPFVNNSLWSMGGDLYQLRRQMFSLATVPTFDETKTGFNFKLGHPVREFTNLFLTYKLEKSFVEQSTIIDRSIISASSVNGWTSSAMASLVFDHRDDRFDPRNGLFWSLSGEYAGLGGDRFFTRTRGEVKFFHPLFWDLVFRTRLTGGSISETTDRPVPVNELFIQGGLMSQRGYRFLSIGPNRTLSSAASGNLSDAAVAAGVEGQSFVIGGHSEVLYQAEIEFPILKEAKIRGVFFFDVGNAFDGSLFKQVPLLYGNVGWGIRWFTPIGPLRFEFGYPILPTGGVPQFYFTIGPPF
jgi:outer membrane protein insertion porin family